VLREAVPPELCDAVVGAIFDFLGMDPNDPEDWYHPPHKPSGFVELYHHATMWAIRQQPRLHEAFSQLWEEDKLWVSIDRVGFKPPRNEDHLDYDDKGFVHWDADTASWPLPFSLQGVLYLNDQTADQGCYQCVPGMHRMFDEWVKGQPADRDTRNPDLTGLEVRQIPANQGDMVIWVRALAHGNGHNVTDRPRFAQYITFSPARPEDEEALNERLASFNERHPLRRPAYTGDDRNWERDQPAPELTELGRKLLGLDRW
jgi:hypothetical protein